MLKNGACACPTGMGMHPRKKVCACRPGSNFSVKEDRCHKCKAGEGWLEERQKCTRCPDKAGLRLNKKRGRCQCKKSGGMFSNLRKKCIRKVICGENQERSLATDKCVKVTVQKQLSIQWYEEEESTLSDYDEEGSD